MPSCSAKRPTITTRWLRWSHGDAADRRSLTTPYGDASVELSVGAYLAGAVLLGGVIGVCPFAAWVVLRRTAPLVRGTPRALAVFLLATAFLGLGHLVPGVLGVLS